MLDRIKNELINFGLKYMSIDEKIVRLLLETSPSSVNEIVILPAVKIVMKKVVDKLKDKRIKGRVYNGLLNGVKVSIIRSLVGAPNAAIIMECLKRSKAKIIIRLDFCGGIYREDNPIDIGNLLIPNSAACGDGTSPYYFLKYPELIKNRSIYDNPLPRIHDLKIGNPRIYITRPDKDLLKLILEKGKKLFQARVKEVNLWTTDALFCETDDFINSLKSKEVQAIDMESSILFLLGELYNIKTASILSISDLPGHSKYDLFKSNEVHPDTFKGIDNAITLLLNILPDLKKTWLKYKFN